MTLDESQIRRYSRHILLPDMGGTGQRRLLASAVAIDVGPGRAAEVAALAYLAAAGVGTVVVRGDVTGAVTAAEAATGILYGCGDVGRARAAAIRDRVAAINPDVTVAERGDGAELAMSPGDDDVASALERGGVAAVQLIARLLQA